MALQRHRGRQKHVLHGVRLLTWPGLLLTSHQLRLMSSLVCSQVLCRGTSIEEEIPHQKNHMFGDSHLIDLERDMWKRRSYRLHDCHVVLQGCNAFLTVASIPFLRGCLMAMMHAFVLNVLIHAFLLMCVVDILNESGVGHWTSLPPFFEGEESRPS